MQAINTAPWFKELLSEHRPPCISIYLPVDRTDAPGGINGRRLREALDEVRQRAQAGLEEFYGKDHMQPALERLEQAMKDDTLLDGDRDALAFFISPDHAHVIEIREPVRPSTTIAETFHVKPLIRALQQSQRFRVLCVALHGVRLFEGDARALREVNLHRAVPRSVDDPIAVQATAIDTTPQGTGNLTPITSQPSYAAGNVENDRFFRLVDQTVWEHYSRHDPVPTVVVADVKTLAGFLAVARNPTRLKEGVQLNPTAASPDRLREEAWRILRPHFEQQINTLKDAYQAARARHLGSDEVPQVAEAAATGRVGTLLLDADVKIPGVFHRDTGMIEPVPPSSPKAEAEDILDDLAELVLERDGQVFIIPHDQMPTDHGVAAVYRY
jgi:hypothetical protein